MNVPDWLDGFSDDYPTLPITPAEAAGSNAQKKAKRKRKQQAEHIQDLLETPVQLHISKAPAVKKIKHTNKDSAERASNPLQEHASQQNPEQAVSARPQSANDGQTLNKYPKQPVSDRAARSKKRNKPKACQGAALDAAEAAGAALDDGHELNAADMRELTALALEASRHSADAPESSSLLEAPDSATAASHQKPAHKHNTGNMRPAGAPLQPGSKAAVPINGISGKAVSKIQPATLAGGKLGVQRASSAASPPAAASQVPAAAAAPPATGTSLQFAADDIAAAAANGSDNPQKRNKLGRKARLRLKRQALQQHQGTPAAVTSAAPGADAADAATTSVEPQLTATAELLTGSKPCTAAQSPEQQAARVTSTSPRIAAGQNSTLGQKKGKGLLEQMRSKLSGGRFRMLNEQLYTTQGQQAYDMMHSQPDTFRQYHEGFQEQTRHWPVQPLDLAIAWLREKDPTWVAADFGCGEARLARSVPQTVHSFDLVAAAPGVVACNMAHVPLEDASVDAAIFCLALMGTDYQMFVQEACRVLRMKGHIWIAEVRSRFYEEQASGEQNKLLSFRACLKRLGFRVTQQDTSNKMFVVFEAIKTAGRKNAAGEVDWPTLKPCMYKRR